MNIQALMKQAQSLQKDMMKVKSEIDKEDLSKEDLEILEDMIVVALRDAFQKVDKELEEKMGKFGNAIPSFF